MSLDFEKYAMKGNEFLNRLAKKLGDENDRHRAARILRSVLRTMRNHLTIEESEQLLAQLPMALKGVYVEGWRIHQPQMRAKTIEDFAGEVFVEEGRAGWRDFSSTEDVIQSIKAVIETLATYVSPEELEQAFNTLPKNLRELFTDWVPS